MRPSPDSSMPSHPPHPGDRCLEFREALGLRPYHRGVRGVLQLLDLMCSPTCGCPPYTTAHTALWALGEDSEGGGPGPAPGLAELPSGPGGTLAHLLWLLSSCGEPDAADSWRLACLAHSSACAGGGFTLITSFHWHAHSAASSLLFCHPHNPAALLS